MISHNFKVLLINAKNIKESSSNIYCFERTDIFKLPILFVTWIRDQTHMPQATSTRWIAPPSTTHQGTSTVDFTSPVCFHRGHDQECPADQKN